MDWDQNIILNISAVLNLINHLRSPCIVGTLTISFLNIQDLMILLVWRLYSLLIPSNDGETTKEYSLHVFCTIIWIVWRLPLNQHLLSSLPTQLGTLALSTPKTTTSYCDRWRRFWVPVQWLRSSEGSPASTRVRDERAGEYSSGVPYPTGANDWTIAIRSSDHGHSRCNQ
jgi:hypothetical protein